MKKDLNTILLIVALIIIGLLALWLGPIVKEKFDYIDSVTESEV